MNLVNTKISSEPVESVPMQSKSELDLVELNQQEGIDFTNKQERENFYSGLGEQAEAVKVMLKNSLYNFSGTDKLLEFSRRTKTPKLLLELSLKNFDQAFKKLSQVLTEGGETNQLVGSLNRYYDEIQLQIEKLNEIVTEMEADLESQAEESVETPIASELNESAPAVVVTSSQENLVDTIPVNLPVKSVPEELETTFDKFTWKNETTNSSPKENLVRQTLKEMVDRPFKTEELLTRTAYEENVRPYVLAGLMAEDVSPAKAEAQVRKSLDWVIMQMVKQGTAPDIVANDINRIISNLYQELREQKELASDTTLAAEQVEGLNSNESGSLIKNKNEAPTPGWDSITLLTEINQRLAELKSTKPEADLAALQEIRTQILRFSEADPMVRRNILNKYREIFNKLADELQPNSATMTAAVVAEPKDTLEPLILTPEMRVDSPEILNDTEVAEIPAPNSLETVEAQPQLELNPETLRQEINQNRLLTDSDRISAQSLFDNYDRMKAEGKSPEALDRMLVSIKDILDTPVTAEAVLNAYNDQPFLTAVEKQTFQTLFDNYERMKAEGKSPESLTGMLNNLTGMLTESTDASVLLARAELIKKEIDQRQSTDPGWAMTANAIYENFQRIAGGNRVSESSTVDSEIAINQAYKNLADFVTIKIPEVSSPTVSVETSDRGDSLAKESLQIIKDRLNLKKKGLLIEGKTGLLQSLNKASLWFRENRRAVRKVAMAAILAEAAAIAATTNSEEVTANHDPISKVEVNDQGLKPVELGITNRVTGFQKNNLNAPVNKDSNPIFSNQASTSSSGAVTGVELPNDLASTHKDLNPDAIFSKKATTVLAEVVPGVEFPIAEATTKFSAGDIQSLTETEPTAFQSDPTYEVQAEDNYWNIMEGQTKAGLMLWQTMVAPEHTQAVISKVKSLIDSSPDLKTSLGFGDSVGKLLPGQLIDIRQLDKLATKIVIENNYLKVDSDNDDEEIAPVSAAADTTVRVLEGDRLFDIVDKNILPTLSSMPTFEQQSVMSDIEKMLTELSPAEIKAMGIASGDINKLEPGEKISLLKVQDVADSALSNRWQSSVISSPTAIEDVNSVNNLMITDTVAKQFVESYPGGPTEFQKDFANYTELVQGGNPEGGWLSSIFAPGKRLNAFNAMKDFPVSEIEIALSTPKQELNAALKERNISVADFEAWRNKYNEITANKTVAIGDPTKTTFGEVIQRGFIASRNNNSKS